MQNESSCHTSQTANSVCEETNSSQTPTSKNNSQTQKFTDNISGTPDSNSHSGRKRKAIG